ncbi:hypothetical protein EDD86DRAFT_221456 [Gorgonomyces haynaldii]|nr:hypothetical protein EDD86DRAFT_221456 [Gorgonomyces haynaldii]
MTRGQERGPQAERFKVSPPTTGSLGPGSYEIDRVTSFGHAILGRPTSEHGVCITRAIRFPPIPNNVPGVGKYEVKGFENYCANPSPGTYDVNYAIGRNVANDNQFGLLKSDRLKWREQANGAQAKSLQEIMGKNDIFTDKRAIRRMRYLALYYPQ